MIDDLIPIPTSAEEAIEFCLLRAQMLENGGYHAEDLRWLVRIARGELSIELPEVEVRIEGEAVKSTWPKILGIEDK